MCCVCVPYRWASAPRWSLWWAPGSFWRCTHKPPRCCTSAALRWEWLERLLQRCLQENHDMQLQVKDSEKDQDFRSRENSLSSELHKLFKRFLVKNTQLLWKNAADQHSPCTKARICSYCSLAWLSFTRSILFCRMRMCFSFMISMAARCSDVWGWGHDSLPAGTVSKSQMSYNKETTDRVNNILKFILLVAVKESQTHRSAGGLRPWRRLRSTWLPSKCRDRDSQQMTRVCKKKKVQLMH